MDFDTRIKIILRDDLQPWQELNITAFLASGLGSLEGELGEPYEDADGNQYLPLNRQPMLVLSASADRLREVRKKAVDRQMEVSVYTKEMFTAHNDEESRAKVRACKAEDLDLVGLLIRGPRNQLDKITKGIPMHP